MPDFNCAACGAALVEPKAVCQSCQASPEWQDLFQAARVAAEQCLALQKRSLLSDAALQRVNEKISSLQLQWTKQVRQSLQPPGNSGLRPPFHCRQCDRPADAAQNFCATCGGPTGARADRLRYLDFTVHLLTNNFADDMAPGTVERCTADLNARIRTLEAELKADATRQSLQEAETAPARGRRSLMEIVLDPQSIRWLLASGGLLLAVGLVIFLSSLGVFKNAAVVASAMGVGTLATLAGGIAIIRLTRHSLAGRAMALLGCLVMPLNLWFYNANQLVTLDGHLWAAAMVCCVLYAAAAFVLEDPMFVYVLFGGISMTGMLVLADLHRLMEISSPATLLVALGLISLHAERAFADDDGRFSRKRFGLACFWSAHAMIGLGLLLLAGSQVAAWLPDFGLGLNQIAALPSNQFLALALVLAGGYSYAYSSMVVRRHWAGGYLAVACLLWAELLGLQIGHLTHHVAVLLSALTLTSLAMNVAIARLTRTEDENHRPLVEPFATLAIGLTAIVLAIGVLPHVRSLLPGVPEVLDVTITWNYFGAIALTAVCSRLAAALNGRKREGHSIAYHVAAAGATFLTIASGLTLLGLHTWPVDATLLMLLPMIYLLAARFHQDGPAKRALPIIATGAAMILAVACLVANAALWINPIAGQATDLWLAAFALEGAAFFAIATITQRGRHNAYLATALVCGMIYQLLGFWALPSPVYNIALALAGVAGLMGHRVFVETDGEADRMHPLFICANSLVSLPIAGVMLLSMSRLALGHTDLSMLWSPAVLIVLALFSALLSAGGARRWYFALTISQIGIGLLSLAQYSTLGVPRKLEFVSVASGLVLLAIGYGLWYRRQDDQPDGGSVCLLMGALMAGLPPAIFALINRFGFEVSVADELTLISIAVLMFLTGMMSRVRTTTLIGGGLLICHLITLVVFAGMKAQLALGAYVSIGGAALFAVGVALSIYRDRLLSLPQRIRQRQGLFRVLAWR